MPDDIPNHERTANTEHKYVSDSGTIGGTANVKVETWVDWQKRFAPDALISADDDLVVREDILASLAAVGIEISATTLRRWEALGYVPRPTRRWHKGATRGLYAPWVVYAAAVAHHLKRRNHDPGLLKLQIRRQTPAFIARSAFHRWFQSLDSLSPFLAEIADRWEAEHQGQRPAGGELVLQDSAGNVMTRFYFDFPRNPEQLSNISEKL